MEMIADIFLGAGALGAAVYCIVLSRRLSRFGNLEQGVGGAVAALSAQVDGMTRALDNARDVAERQSGGLDRATLRAEEVARRLELLVASMHDLPDEPPVALRADRAPPPSPHPAEAVPSRRDVPPPPDVAASAAETSAVGAKGGPDAPERASPIAPPPAPPTDEPEWTSADRSDAKPVREPALEAEAAPVASKEPEPDAALPDGQVTPSLSHVVSVGRVWRGRASAKPKVAAAGSLFSAPPPALKSPDVSPSAPTLSFRHARVDAASPAERRVEAAE